ncbi:divergent polysaccharide deacetylase family protein [Hyphobacterium sp. SN044]|uniref:divergent polysaccharide deacetylase family protein n=1 Tax=Hyphobacterium sp. SN044 TaxID=2912575 RepID=UPI001F18CFD9|nr:divergent polysaccharide deacetylase family protein [Hyphobacterium sp. SN044]MCF8879104.1 divergent polysaccharide deacetylase family protein [Hyphobacterium sp. SN044]
MPRRAINSAMPILAGSIAAMAFAMGAIAHDAGYRRGLTLAVNVVEAERVEAETFTGLPTRESFEREAPSRYTQIPEPPRDRGPASVSGPAIILVIDDIGADEALSMRALDLPAEINFAILPNTELAPEFAVAARGRGHETLIHLPMQPAGEGDPGPNALAAGQSADTVRDTLQWAMAQVPGARGFNNHMGSALTLDEAAMTTLFSEARAFDLYFLDSVTAPRSIAARIANNNGIEAASRDIFIDHINNIEAIEAQLRVIEYQADQDGHVIAIGHPRELTLDALAAWIPEAEARGYRFVALGDWLDSRNDPVRLAASGEAPGFPGGSD